MLTLLSNAALADPMDLILKDLKSKIGTTNTYFYTYSYAKVADVGLTRGESADASDAKTKSFLITKASGYFDLNVSVSSGTMPGFYLALDPIASRSYGGDTPNWVLYRIQIPKGLRFLDISMNRSGWEASKMSDTIIKSLKALGCEPKPLDAENFSYQHLFQYDEGNGCRKIVNQILNQIGADMIQYRWTAAEIPGCTGNNDESFDERAIILLHPEKLSHNAIRVFTADTPDTPEYRKEKRRLDELMQLADMPSNLRLWSTFSHPINRNELQDWSRMHLLNCME
jgi:hypothetical protein